MVVGVAILNCGLRISNCGLENVETRFDNPQSAIPNPKSSLIRPSVNRFGDHFRVGNGGGIERRAAPGDVQRHPRKIDNAAVAAVAAQIVRRPHEYAIDGTRLDTQRTKHALRIVDRVAGDFETLAVLDPLLADVDAVYRASLRALIAGDTGCQIEAVEAAIPCGNRNGQLRVFEMLGECFALRPIGFYPRSKRDPHAMRNGVDRLDDVAHPGPNSLHFVDHWAERIPFIDAPRLVRALRNGQSANSPRCHVNSDCCE
jgi:hypothetical protein